MTRILYILLLSVVSLYCFPVKALPQRIAALAPHAVEMLYALDAGDKIIATTEHADYPEAAKSIERIGGYHGISIERLVELNPDLVIVWQSGNQREQIEQIKALGFNIFESEPDSLKKIAEEMQALGAVIGHQAQAELAVSSYRMRLKQISEKYHSTAPIKVFYQLWSRPLRTVANDSWIQELIATCHGENVYAQASVDYPQVSIENVLQKQPEVIIIPQHHGSNRPDEINWQQWPEIPAVKHQQIYHLNGDILHRAAPRALEGLEKLCETFAKAASVY
jgi:vitamin B12 transport system substrate-binding protein